MKDLPEVGSDSEAPGSDRRGRAVPLALAVGGAVAIAVGAQLTVPLPGTVVPQTAQTLAVVLVAALGGARIGVGAVGLYVLAGIIGLPVFASGGGLDRVLGASGGYFLGFALGAAVAGRRGPGRRSFGKTFAILVLAHIAILTCGWARLTLALGPGDAWIRGVAPFLVGGLAKSLLAAIVVQLMDRRGAQRNSPAV